MSEKPTSSNDKPNVSELTDKDGERLQKTETKEKSPLPTKETIEQEKPV